MQRSICQNEIVFLQKEKDVILRKIRIQEHLMNYREEEATLRLTDINDLQELILKFFRVLSLIDAYGYLETKHQTVTESFFLNIVNNRYFSRLNIFINDLIFAVSQMSKKNVNILN